MTKELDGESQKRGQVVGGGRSCCRRWELGVRGRGELKEGIQLGVSY